MGGMGQGKGAVLGPRTLSSLNLREQPQILCLHVLQMRLCLSAPIPGSQGRSILQAQQAQGLSTSLHRRLQPLQGVHLPVQLVMRRHERETLLLCCVS